MSVAESIAAVLAKVALALAPSIVERRVDWHKASRAAADERVRQRFQCPHCKGARRLAEGLSIKPCHHCGGKGLR